jgi:hypothetical protein
MSHQSQIHMTAEQQATFLATAPQLVKAFYEVTYGAGANLDNPMIRNDLQTHRFEKAKAALRTIAFMMPEGAMATLDNQRQPEVTADHLHDFHLRTFDNRFTGCNANERIRMQRLEMLYQHAESCLTRMTDNERANEPDMLESEAARLAAIETPYVADAYLTIGGRRWPLTWQHRENVERAS